MEILRFVDISPRLYHMAEKGTWESIRKRGLFSASAVLTHFGISGRERDAMEAEQRPAKMEVGIGRPDSIVLRDQKPMPRERLALALKDGTTPEEWYRLINSKVFFWAHEQRLLTLLNARDYRVLEHDVLTIDTGRFIRAYSDRIWLCHMNSGNTWPIPHHRGKDVFKRIGDYPTNSKGNPRKPVAEVVVDDQVPDIAEYVVAVRRMKGAQVLGTLL